MVRSSAEKLGRILVTEDDRVLMRFYKQALSSVCQEPVVVGSNAEAVLELDKSHFDFMIADMQLPGEDGMELVKYASSTQPSLPILVASGYIDDAKYRERGNGNSSIRGYLEKPFTVEQLIQKIDDIIAASGNHQG